MEHIITNGFINLQFLQKLGSQKPFWDEARLFSLVNKRFAAGLPAEEEGGAGEGEEGDQEGCGYEFFAVHYVTALLCLDTFPMWSTIFIFSCIRLVRDVQ